MSELMIINPIKGRSRRRKAGKRSVAHLKKYWFKKGRKSRKLESKGIPVMAKRRRKRRVFRARKNPIVRHRRHHVARVHRRKRRYLSNPIKSPLSFAKAQLMPSAIGAVGALGLDIVLGMIPLPDSLKTPTVRPFIRLAGAVGLGMLASSFLDKSKGEAIAAGAITVTLYDVLKGFVATQMPTLNLSGYSESPMYLPIDNADGMGVYPSDGMGVYPNGMGEYVQ